MVLLLIAYAVLADEIVSQPESGMAPLPVEFSVRSATAVDSYAWDFTSDGTMDSVDPTPKFTYDDEGKYEASVIINQSGNSTVLKKIIIVQSPVQVSIVAVPTSGKAPLSVQFTAAATGKEPLTYSWDFDGDNSPDSLQQNPSTTYQNPGEYKARLTVTDGAGNKVLRDIPINASKFDSHLALVSAFPSSLTVGENQVTIIVSNEGMEQLRDITAKLVGKGIQHLTSTSISILNVGDQDSLTVKLNVQKELEGKEIDVTLKGMDKSFPLKFNVSKQAHYDKEALQVQLAELKSRLNEQEKIYYAKKSEGFLVSEIYDSIKNTQKQLLDAQQQLLTSKFSDAQVNMQLTGAAISDITVNLEGVKKQKVTLLMWFKDNAVAIAAIIAAVGTIGGFAVKAAHSAKAGAGKVKDQAEKLGQNLKDKFPLKKKDTPAQPAATQAVIDSPKDEKLT